MRFILDTNIVIPIEPTSTDDVEDGTPIVAELLRSLGAGRHSWLIHPGTYDDVKRDTDSKRRALRLQLLEKYPAVQEPPVLAPPIVEELGRPDPGSNDEVDFLILSALAADCADYVVTDDQRMRRRAVRVGLGQRVLSAAEALAVVRALFPSVPIPPPLVKVLRAHSLNDNDKIFESLRADYPAFQDWLRKCKREQRQAWVIEREGSYAGLCIINEETKPEYGLNGRVLKLCTLKISESHRGFRYGELLLKTIFDYLIKNNFDHTFVEVFEKHEELCALLGDFGFSQRGTSHRSELVLAKTMKPDTAAIAMTALDYHVAFGPQHLRIADAPGFVVPIQPRYHGMLFPEAESQLSLVTSSHAFGNSIRKAYLSHSKIRRLTPGAFLLFYRSVDAKSVGTVGVVEDTLVSDQAVDIARFVGKRTVYDFKEIQELSTKPVLAVLFRQARLLDKPWPLELLKRSGIVNGPPQSFVSVPESARQWLMHHLA